MIECWGAKLVMSNNGYVNHPNTNLETCEYACKRKYMIWVGKCSLKAEIEHWPTRGLKKFKKVRIFARGGAQKFLQKFLQKSREIFENLPLP